MRILGRQFVMGRTIDEALERAARRRSGAIAIPSTCWARRRAPPRDAERYPDAYRDAIARHRPAPSAGRGPIEAPGHLGQALGAASALRVRPARAGRWPSWCRGSSALARSAPRGRHRLHHRRRGGRPPRPLARRDRGGRRRSRARRLGRARPRGPGLSEARAAADRLARRPARTASGRRLMVRLVKGAYWDSEIKRARSAGLPGYPVFTRKVATDVSYLACARRLLADADAFYPQFATHNAHTLAAVLEMARQPAREFEFQRLHGMGEALYDEVVAAGCQRRSPAGSMRRSAATRTCWPIWCAGCSRTAPTPPSSTASSTRSCPIDEIIADPVARDPPAAATSRIRASRCRVALFGPERRNSSGIDLTDRRRGCAAGRGDDEAAARALARRAADRRRGAAGRGPSRARPRRPRAAASARWPRPAADAGRPGAGAGGARRSRTGNAGGAERARAAWNAPPICWRQDRAELMALCSPRGRQDHPRRASSEVREAVDFLRYYAAARARRFRRAEALPGPTGERNQLALHGRGVFACISPWNFPLAIFTGQIAAALAAGNAVIAKPAEQTPLIAAARGRAAASSRACRAMCCICCRATGRRSARPLVADPRIAGVAFTGSTDTAQRDQPRAGRARRPDRRR